MRGKASMLVLVAALTAGLLVPAAVGAATVLKAKLTGAEIVNDDGGAPRGGGQAMLRLDPERDRICFEISYSGLGGNATAGYLRKGAAGRMARPVVVLFAGRAPSPVSACVGAVGKRTMSGLKDRPGGYYVDLATAKLPKGAVRGQLRDGGEGEAQLGGPPSGGIG